MKQMLNVLVEAERCAIRTFTETALTILHEEVEHEAWFSEHLSEGTPATSAAASQVRRRTCGAS